MPHVEFKANASSLSRSGKGLRIRRSAGIGAVIVDRVFWRTSSPPPIMRWSFVRIARPMRNFWPFNAAAIQKGQGRLDDCDIYITLEPCPMCAQAISLARLRRVYFGAYDPKGGGVDHGARIFNASSCHHTPEIIGGIEEEKCGKLLTRFFQKRR
jgi:hypothetical protein